MEILIFRFPTLQSWGTGGERMDMDFIRKRITELRLAKGVSELAMSQALGHGRAYITHITSGRANPSVPELLYIIEYLDLTPRTFFTEGHENESLLLQKIMGRLQKHSEDDLAMFLNLLDRMDGTKP